MLKGKLKFFDTEIYTIWLMKFIKCFFDKCCYFKVIMEYKIRNKGRVRLGKYFELFVCSNFGPTPALEPR